MASLKIKQLRIQKDIQQKTIATLLGVTPRTIRTWETGDYEPKIDQLIALADYFDVSLDYLVGRTDDPKNERR